MSSRSSATGTVFTVTAVASPSPVACTINVTDGVNRSPLVVNVTYNTSTVTVK